MVQACTLLLLAPAKQQSSIESSSLDHSEPCVVVVVVVDHHSIGLLVGKNLHRTREAHSRVGIVVVD
jgi:hypothetical protein